MNYDVKVRRSCDALVLAGTFRFLLGLVLAFAGLYIATLSQVQGHGLGLLLVLGSPFVIFKDDE